MTEGLVGGEGFAVGASLIRAVANRQTGGPGSEGLPPNADNRAVREHLATLDYAAFGAATPVVPKFLAPADPASRWTCAYGGQAYYAYSTNYLIDLDHAVIMDVEASTAIQQAEVTACKRMIARGGPLQNRARKTAATCSRDAARRARTARSCAPSAKALGAQSGGSSHQDPPTHHRFPLKQSGRTRHATVDKSLTCERRVSRRFYDN